jgi:hypothetical protein
VGEAEESGLGLLVVRSIPSSTVVGGHLAIRPCFINPHTRLADVDALVDHVITIGDELTGMQSG